jgi:hypothetical protein
MWMSKGKCLAAGSGRASHFSANAVFRHVTLLLINLPVQELRSLIDRHPFLQPFKPVHDDVDLRDYFSVGLVRQKGQPE